MPIRARRTRWTASSPPAASCFAEAALPADVEAVWWPRFEKLAANIIEWERGRADAVARRHAEERADKTAVGRPA